MRRTIKRSGGTCLVAAFASIASLVIVRAQQAPSAQGQQPPAGGQPARGQQPGQPQQGTPAPLPKPLTPVAASTLLAHPEAYYGQHVTLTAAVDQILTPTAFAVEQGKASPSGKDLLVLTPVLHGRVEQNAYVTVIGEVVAFDPDEIAKKTPNVKIDLTPDAVAIYRGGPAVIATGVINTAFVDLTKRLPPPMTAEEESFSKVMKKVGPAFAALRGAMDGSKPEVVSENASTLKSAFTETEAFWKSKGRPDATQWAQGARKQAETIEKAAAAGKWEDVKTSAGNLGQACQTCHTAYRERFDDGSFRIKVGPAKTGNSALR
jgi:cytochrome c556